MFDLIVRHNYWEITSPNTNGDPNDNEEFQWYVHGDGTVHRVLTEHEQNEKNRREWAEKCRERRKEEDILERYCYQILRRVPWYDQSSEEIGARTSTSRSIMKRKRKRKRRSEPDICRWAILDKEIERRHLHHGEMPKGMTNKRWQAVKSNIRGLDNEAKKQSDIDLSITQNNPTGILYYRMNKLFFMCECTRESLRNGKICDICKLIKRGK